MAEPGNIADLFNFEKIKQMFLDIFYKCLELIMEVWVEIPLPVKILMALFVLLICGAFVYLAYINRNEWKHVQT